MLAAPAPDETLTRAAAANQTAWMARIAEAAGGVVRRERGVTWMASAAGAVLALSRLSRERLDAVAALDLGRAAGCSIATLNATPQGELLYRQLGFRSVGLAQT